MRPGPSFGSGCLATIREQLIDKRPALGNSGGKLSEFCDRVLSPFEHQPCPG